MLQLRKLIAWESSSVMRDGGRVLAQIDFKYNTTVVYHDVVDEVSSWCREAREGESNAACGVVKGTIVAVQ